jgi:RHS repeat-associated protein
VHDPVDDNNYKASINGIDDLDKQDAGNYQYDNIGNLIADVKADIQKITWTVDGKLSSISKTDGTTIAYAYDPAGNRVKKVVTINNVPAITWYTLDAAGKTIAVYSDKQEGTTGTWWKEQHLYGTGRLGMWTPGINIASANGTNSWGILGKKTYELVNHLENVLATITDKKIAVPSSTDNAVLDHYEAEVTSAQDYYPFGMLMPDRKWNLNSYRFGFNGKENDNEVKGEGNQQDYGMRIYDQRVGRFLSVDPLTQKYPELTPYQFSSNRPIDGADLDGMEYGIMGYNDPKQMLYQGLSDLATAGANLVDKFSFKGEGVIGWFENLFTGTTTKVDLEHNLKGSAQFQSNVTEYFKYMRFSNTTIGAPQLFNFEASLKKETALVVEIKYGPITFSNKYTGNNKNEDKAEASIEVPLPAPGASVKSTVGLSTNHNGTNKVEVKVEPTLRLGDYAKAKASYGAAVTLRNGKVQKVESSVGGEIKVGTIVGFKIGGNLTTGVSF